MVVQCANFDDLLALPARRQHRTLLPIVNIDRLTIKVLVIASAKVAHLFILTIIVRNFSLCPIVLTDYLLRRILRINLLWVVYSGWLLLLIVGLGLWNLTPIDQLFIAWLCCRFFDTSRPIWIYICLDYFRFRLLITWMIVIIGDPGSFSKLLLDLLNLCLPQPSKVIPNFVAQVPVQLHDALLGRLANILQRVRQTLRSKGETLAQLVLVDLLVFG